MKQFVTRTVWLISALAVGSMLAAPAVRAQNGELSAAAKKMEKHQARRELAALRKYDANGNGVLDPEEVAAKKADAKARRQATLIRKYDANGNGKLDPDEEAKMNADLKAKHDAAVLKKYDKNRNGTLDPDELALKQANDAKMQALRDARNRKAGLNQGTASAEPAPEAVAATGN